MREIYESQYTCCRALMGVVEKNILGCQCVVMDPDPLMISSNRPLVILAVWYHLYTVIQKRRYQGSNLG